MSSDYEYEDEGYEDEDEDEDYGGEDFQDEYSQEDHSQGDHSQEERSQKEHTQEDYNDDDLSDATQDDDRDASYNNMNVDTDGSYSTVTDKPTRKADDMNSPSMEAGAETDTISEHGPNRTPPLSSSSPSPSDSLHKTLQSLLTALTKLRTVRGPLVNGHTFFLFLELLNFRDANIASGVESTNSDVELFLDFLPHLLREGSLQIGSYTRDVTTKARKLVFKLASKTHVLPRSLFITDIEKDPHAIAVGGFGRVFKGKYGGQLVALKMLYQSRRAGESIEKNLYTEALTWRSLSHRYILPLLGIYEEGSQLFLVSPFMTNGALGDWRKNHVPVQVDEIRRLLLEVAEGVQYIHSEGIVHGDLHSGNVLLDSEFHCQLTDFGSTRHFEVTVTRSTTALQLHFAAPELFGMCATCGKLDCDE